MRSALYKSKKGYDRKRLKKAGITNDSLSFSHIKSEFFIKMYPKLVIY